MNSILQYSTNIAANVPSAAEPAKNEVQLSRAVWKALGARKSLTIRLMLLDGRRVTRVVRSGARRLLMPRGIDCLLDRFAAQVLADFPASEFRLVPLRDGNFNFVEVKSTHVEPAWSEEAVAD